MNNFRKTFGWSSAAWSAPAAPGSELPPDPSEELDEEEDDEDDDEESGAAPEGEEEGEPEPGGAGSPG